MGAKAIYGGADIAFMQQAATARAKYLRSLL
jgi:hypothetical protein